jgi:hypothetical protein
MPAAAGLGLDAIKQFLRRDSGIGLTFAALALASVVLIVMRPRRAAGYALGLLSACGFIGVTFPSTANHTYISLAVLGMGLATTMLPVREAPSIFAVARWLAFSVLLWSGGQKLLHGTYDHGEFFAYQIARGEPRFSAFWSLLLPADELSRLHALRSAGFAASGIQMTYGPAIVLSMAIPLLEIATALLMTSRQTRRWAVIAALSLVLAIQLIASELTFAVVMCGLLTVFLRIRASVWIARVAVLGAALMALVASIYSASIFN